MKNILFGLVVVLLSNYAVDAVKPQLKYQEFEDRVVYYDEAGNVSVILKKTAPPQYVLAIKDQEMESVKGFPSLGECAVAKKKAIKKDGRAWDCFRIDYN